MVWLHISVMGLVLVQASTPAPQPLDPKTDADAYALYATLLQPRWEQYARVNGPMLLQRETEGPLTGTCSAFLAAMSGEWAEVARSFQRENKRVRVLQAAVPMTLPYRLISRAAILADDARLSRKYPGRWQRTPGSLEYAAVSAVGFNAARTKALVYVRLRMSGDILRMELKDGRWIAAQGSACGWIARRHVHPITVGIAESVEYLVRAEPCSLTESHGRGSFYPFDYNTRSTPRLSSEDV